MWAFVRQPRWIVGHALTLTLLVVFTCAGLWQWSRHTERQARNADITTAANAAPLSANDLPATSDDAFVEAFVEANEWRSVRLRGRWVTTDAVLVRNRSHDGLAGCHLAAPFALAQGALNWSGNRGDSERDSQPGVMAVAGWLDQTHCNSDQLSQLASGTFPTTEVTLTGRIRPTQTRGWFGPADAAAGKLASVARVEVERLRQQTSVDLFSFYVELVEHQPTLTASVAAPLVLLRDPATDAGPHLGYSLQWFAFALVALVGYPLVLWRQAHSRTSIPEPEQELTT